MGNISISGDIKTAIASYTNRGSSQAKEQSSGGIIERRPDSINISIEGLLASEGYNKNGVKAVRQDNGTYNIKFKNTAFIYGAVKRGSVEVDGKQVLLDDEAKNKLSRTAKNINARQNRLTDAAAALHNAHVYDQQNKALESQQKKDIQAQGIASRMSKGNIVSPKEESVLLKYDPELYLMAKLSQHMAEMHKKDHRQVEKEKTQKQDGWESPLEHIPEISADINVSTDSGSLEINSITETFEER